MTTFDRDTAIAPLADGRFSAEIDERWLVVRGPNGGYVAAIILRALMDAQPDPERTPRSFTIQYPRAPQPGPVEVSVAIEHTGRALTSMSARMEQDGKLMALALAAFASSRE